MSDKITDDLDYKQTWDKRWRTICTNPDGSLNLDQIMRELHDYAFMLEEVPKVYCEVTGNRLSKPNYYADSVISAFEDEVQKRIEQHEKDQVEDSNSRLVLFMRYFDSNSNEWSPWGEPDERNLHSIYGHIPEQWKANCEAWISTGGKYEFKIVRRTDVTEWVTSYKNEPRK